MIDFSTLKGLTIPEGNVKQISDAQGNVLWSAAPKVKFVPIVDLGTINPKQNSVVNLAEKPAGYDACTHALINGVVYEATGALSGTAFAYQISDSDSVYQIVVSTTNNVVLVSSHKEGTYTVQLGVCIQIRNDPATVEIGKGLIYKNQDYAYFEVDGVKYYASTTENKVLTFPAGTNMRFVAKAISTLGSDNKATINLNGQTVVQKTAIKGTTPVTATYDYVVTGNMHIYFSVTYMASGTTTMQGLSTITIKET